MATTYPLPTLGPTIGPDGISIPSFEDVLKSIQAIYRGIYGQGIYIDADSQDGQWINALARVVNDSNQAAVTVFQAFSPTYAQGTQLSSVVKINGIARNIPTNSTVIGEVSGIVGGEIIDGYVVDADGNLWDLPASVIVEPSGVTTVTATAREPGTKVAIAGSITKIGNPQYGWSGFVNTEDAVPGAPVESDSALRRRQARSPALGANTVLDAIYAAVGNCPGVTRWEVYENDTDAPNADGIPAHTISVVELGGQVADIVQAIGSKKAPGVQTYGDITGTYFNKRGLPTPIHFFELDEVQVYFAYTIKALPGYVTSTGVASVAALVAFINSLEIGEDVYMAQAFAAAQLIGSDLGQTFYITDFFLGFAPNPATTANLPILFNQAADSAVANVILTET